MSNQLASTLLNSTVQAFNGETTSVSAVDGISLIDNWLTALRSGDADETVNPVANTLSELKIQLQGGDPNSGQIKVILEELATQTEDSAKSADDSLQPQLGQLAQALRDFGLVINGEGKHHTEPGKGQIFTQTHTGSAAGNAGAMRGGAMGTSPEADAPDGSNRNGSGTNSHTDDEGRAQSSSTHEGGGQSSGQI